MRNGIREKLLSSVPGIRNVYEPHAASADSEKPYLVVAQGNETEESDWAGFRRIIEVWPYLSRNSFEEVDATAEAVIGALDEQLIADPVTGEVFTCRYQGTAGPDQADEEWNAITRGLRFAVVAVQPLHHIETSISDPWLDALSSWTEQLLGSGWAVYRGLWPLGYRQPSVMWRLAGTEAKGGGKLPFEIRKRFVGHVIGTSQTEQTAAAVLIPWQLQAAIKIPLSETNRRYLTVQEVKADHQADALTAGQIKLELKQLVSRPDEIAPLIGRVYADGKFL